MIDIIVVKYKEDTSWVSRLDSNKFNIVLYNKLDDIDTPNNNNLPNIGKESYAYISHIVNNYYNLSESMIFLHGFPIDHCGNTPEIWNSYFKDINFFNEYCSYYKWPGRNYKELTDKLTTQFINYLNNKNNFDFHAFGNILDCVPILAEQKRLLFKKLDIDYDPYSKFSTGAEFVVPSLYIKNKSLSFWKTLLDLHVRDETFQIDPQTMPFILEQSWMDIFNYKEKN